ncbi:MAG TPA: histidine kinase, partial [Actinomycetota bacterium]
MTVRTARRIAWLLLGLDLFLTAAGIALVVLNLDTELPPGPSSVLSDAAILLAFLPFGLVGALIFSRQPGNPIGSIFLVTGIGMAIGITSFEYVIYADLTNPGSLRGVDWALRVSLWLSVVPLAAYLLLFLLFPDGHLPSRRWLAVAGLALVSMTWLEANNVAPETIPFEPARALATAAMVLCAAAPLFRYRVAGAEEREQIRWFAFAALPAVAFLGGQLYINPTDLYLVPALLTTAAVPFATAVAIFRHRLYDIDLIVNRALVYGGLAAFVSIVYVLIVVVVGAFVGATEFLSLVATGIVAVAFQSVYHRMQAVARRWVYGDRATPYETLASLSGRLAESYSIEGILPTMARVLANGTGATRAEVWLRVGSELRPAASWPPENGGTSSPVPVREDTHPRIATATRIEAATREADVRHQGELLGAFVVTKPPNDPFTSAEEKLLADLSSQAGLVLRNAVLIADLRASRQRLVSAQDEERRKIERNLHDGAQQQLVALAVKMRLIEGMANKESEHQLAELAHGLVGEIGDALESLRELAHGIYPPLLADQGLAAALSSQARKATIPVDVDADGLGRYPQEVEAAVYFCCLEALQNVGKYANATAARITLAEAAGVLRF